MKNEPAVFGASAEGLRKALGKSFTPELSARMRELGIDFENPAVAFPHEIWLKCLREVAATVLHDVPEGDRYRKLGFLFMQGFTQRGIGLAALTAAKVFGVKRTLMRMERNFRTAANYVETSAIEISPRDIELRIGVLPEFKEQLTDQTMLTAEYRQGVLEGVLAVLNVQGQVTLVKADTRAQDFTYRVSWV